MHGDIYLLGLLIKLFVVEEKTGKQLLERFGLVFDGWSSGSTVDHQPQVQIFLEATSQSFLRRN